jgi:DNA-binding PadR family transcriptional regulator
MSRRTGVLDLAVLGLLHESPLHGYELRKRLNAMLGPFRALSYGTLYPCLKELLAQGWLVETDAARSGAARGRIVYELTPEGKEHFQDLVAESGPAAWEDGSFDVRFAFFSRTEAAVRLRILEGRRTRLEERLDNVKVAATRARERVDSYTQELQRHGLDSVEREVRWLNELIETERRSAAPAPQSAVPPETARTENARSITKSVTKSST